MKNLMAMSAQEILMVSTLAELAREAQNAVQRINEHFRTGFGIGNKEIQVYETEGCGKYHGVGYLNIDGVFRYTDNMNGGREYSFNCDLDSIYRLLRSCYLREHNMANLESEPFECQIEHIDTYFREFIKGLGNEKSAGADGKIPTGN